MSGGRTVTAVVLSYNRPAELAESLAALRGQSRAPDELIVVDNASPRAAEIEEVARAVAARFVQVGRNSGYTGGMNRGISMATGDWLFLTEDDIVAEDRCLELLLADAETHPGAAISGPLMLNRRAGTIRSAGCEVALDSIFRQHVLGENERDIGQYQERVAVDFLPGAALFAPRRLLLDLGGFREEYFMYFEDLELCLRARQRGHDVVLVPQARVAHFEPPASPLSSALEYHKIRNLAATYLLHADRKVLSSFALRYGALGALRALGAPRRLGAHLRAWAWVLRNWRSLLAERR
jgi:GT2 family glycosyltransferase